METVGVRHGLSQVGWGIFIFACSASSLLAQDLSVVQVSPQGQIASMDQAREIMATFSQPMVPLATPPEGRGSGFLRIAPSVEGRFRWRGTNVLVFIPDRPLPLASGFRVAIPGEAISAVTKKRLGGEYTWTFETVRPALVDSRPRNGDRWIDLRPTIFLVFNMRMTPERARGFITVQESPLGLGASRSVPVLIRPVPMEELKKVWPYEYGRPPVENVLAVSPAGPFRPDSTISVILAEGLRGAEGALGVGSARVVNFETWYTFRQSGSRMPHCLSNDPIVRFTNPIRLAELYTHLHVDPPAPLARPDSYRGESTGQQDHQNREVEFSLSELRLSTGTAYRIWFDKDLKDVFGNRLGQIAAMETPPLDFCPFLSMSGGVGILESYLAPLHPVWALNVASAPLRMFRVSPDQVVQYFESRADGQAARREEEWLWRAKKPDVPEDKAQLVVDRLWTPGLPHNRGGRVGLDLREALGSRKSGFVHVGLMGPSGEWHSAFLNVTNLGLTLKASPESTLVWVSFLRRGNPVAGARVDILDTSGRVLWSGQTDRSGFAQAPGWRRLGIADWSRWSRPRLWAIARLGDQVAAVRTDWHGGIEGWRLGVPYEWAPRPFHNQATVFTDRGVYRSGEVVYLKGILRSLEQGDWTLPELKEVMLTMRDPRGNEVLVTTVPVTRWGSFDYRRELPRECPTGPWTVRVTEPFQKANATVEVADAEEYAYGQERRLDVSASFRVEPFKPATFEVRAIPERKEYLVGERFQATIEGWYLFGAPMAEARAEWTMRIEPSRFSPPAPEGFSFSPPWWRHEGFHGFLLAQSTATLDLHGRAVVQIDLGARQARVPLAAVFEASASSPDRQRLFGRVTVPIHPARVYVGIRPSSTFLEKGREWSAETIVVRPDGQAVRGVEVRWQIIRREWLSVQRAGVAGRLEWVSEQRDVSVSTFTVVSSSQPGRLVFTPDRPGLYLVEASASDEQGRETAAGESFYVVGRGDAWWQREDTDIIELVPDKKRYKPGEVARILVKSPYESARVVVTLERERIHKRWTAEIEGGAAFIAVPIEPEHVPNVFVSVLLVRGRTAEGKFDEAGRDVGKPQAKIGCVDLPVDPAGRRLDVEVKTDRTEYRPRGRVTTTVQVRDAQRAGVRAEVTVFVVDEGVLALTGYQTPDPFRSFYGSRPLWVETAESLLYLIGQRSFGEKGEARGGAEGLKGALEGVDLRARFVPTAYWRPRVETDLNGKATVVFDLPDNLSRFRVMAVAHEGRRFGGGESRFVVTKPLQLRPSLPRFARIGDTFQGGIVLHNYTSGVATVTVIAEMSGVAIQMNGERSREVVLPSGSAREVTWLCLAVKDGKALFRFRARTGMETDGLEWPLVVQTPHAIETVATLSATDLEAEERIDPPPDFVPGVGGLEVRLSPTALAGVQEGVKYLLTYPYGCLEQRLSQVLPVVSAGDLIETFGLGSLEVLKPSVKETLARLGDFQAPAGGFGYWPNPSRADPFVTCYTLEVASIAVREGYEVDPAVLRRAVRWLRGFLATNQPDWAYPYSRSAEFAARAYAVYVLALHGEPDPATLATLVERRGQTPLIGKAYLLRAVGPSRGDPAHAQILAQDLINAAKYEPAAAHFEEPEDEGLEWILHSNVRTTAVCLHALLEARGGFPGDEKVVRWLTEERRIRGRWRTTQENAAVFRAFQEYYRRYERERPDFTISAVLGDAVWDEKFTGRTLETRVRVFPIDQVRRDSPTPFRIQKAGAGRVYYTLRLSYARAQGLPPAEEGFSITKHMEPLHQGPVRAGRRAVVTLRVATSQDRTFVVVDDPLPAGFEVVDPSFSVESGEDARLLGERRIRGSAWGTFHRAEHYDDRVLLFADYLPAGEHSYSYLVQATTPGRYSQPVTKVEQMYRPEVFGRTGVSVVVVE